MYEYKAKLKRVVDGDTIEFIIDVGFKMTTTQRIRLAHVNTPEMFRVKKDSLEYKKGLAAKEYVEKRLADNHNEVLLKTFKHTGKYGRYIAIVNLKDSEISLNDELLNSRHASKA